jgi:hypothetical protein
MKKVAILVLSLAAAGLLVSPQPASATVAPECLGPSGGVPYTPGWWKSKHGQAAVGETDLFVLRSQNLYNADGTPFNPTTYAELRAWLNAVNANNMVYALSVHFAVGVLNVINGAVSSSLLIYAPGTIAGGADGIATLSAVLHEANAALGAETDGVSYAGDPNRSYLEALKNAIDNANNDINFIQQACLF